jgi:ABC-type multidrug transport system ATPase subunit
VLYQEGGHESYLIEFKNMTLTLKTGTTVMDGVHGRFQPGRLCAVMGPSGAGKTTIINLVTGKVPSTKGQIFVNGEEMSGLTKYQKLVGFVPQEDVMLRELTVRDNIAFSAKYRLPDSLSDKEVDDRVNATIRSRSWVLVVDQEINPLFLNLM